LDGKEEIVDISKLFCTYQATINHHLETNSISLERGCQDKLSQSHIFVLKPQQHTSTMLGVFGEQVLDAVHDDLFTKLLPKPCAFNSEKLETIRTYIKV